MMPTATAVARPGVRLDAPGPQPHQPALLLVAHGSRDPRSASHLCRLADRIGELAPELSVGLGFLEQSEPSVAQALSHLVQAGQEDIVVVPMLLGSAFHAEIDLPAQLEATQVGTRLHQSRVIGTDPGMADVLEAAARPLERCDGFVLLAAGSSDPQARAELVDRADDLARRLDRPVEAAFVTCEPDLQTAADRLSRRGVNRPGLVPWFLAPGLLLDRGLHQARELGVSDVGPTVAQSLQLPTIVLRRYRDEARVIALTRASSIS